MTPMHGLLLQRLLQLALAVLIAACSPLAALDQAPKPPAWSSGCGTDSVGTWADLVVNGSVLRLRWIPPGSFTMGSPRDEADRDQDEVQHQVALSRGFWLGESETTRRFFRAVMGSNPNGGEELLPVAISFEEGQQFFAKLNDGKPGLGADFPTEAQWEYACRAGTRGPTYAPLDAAAWYLVNSLDAYGNNLVHPVKQKQANAWGLYDMLGNAWEMTRDWYGDYPTAAVKDPPGPSSGNRHVVRGGSCRNAAGSCRAAWRWAEFPQAKGFGIRCMVPSLP